VKVLIDECLPRRLTRVLPGHAAKTVPQAGWAGKSNGELLALMDGWFNVFLTIDRDLAVQQNLAELRVATIIIRANSNALEDVEPLVSEILRALQTSKKGDVVKLVD
jgi:predicted nuclease of predicted toxin-antitoxin system